MKIALVTWSFDTVQGISRCVVELARRLAARHEVHVFASAVEAEAPAGVSVHRVTLRVRRRYARDWEFFLAAGLRLRRERFDLVHAHCPVWRRADVYTSQGVPRCALEAVRRLPPEARQDVPFTRLLPLYLEFPLDYHLRDPKTTIVAVSERARREVIRAHGRRPEELHLIPNGVDLERFHPGLARRWRAPVRESLGLADDRLVLLFVGNNPWVKGLRHALRLIARLPDRYALVVLGPHSSATVAGLEREAAELERSGRLRFAGRQVEVQSYYAAADAVIVPSVYESFGLVVLEGMAMGLPVFTSRAVAAGEELIRDGENGFVVEQPAEVEETARQITALMASPEQYRRVAARARATAEEYSWDRHASRTEELYRSVLAARGAAGARERARV